MRRSGRPAALALAGLLLTAACHEGGDPEPRRRVAGGDRERGRELLRGYTCGGCHEIPGVYGAHGQVGPPLTAWAERTFIAGAVPNDPAHLMRWLMDPQAIEPGTSMPDMGVSAEEARHMAAYLFTLDGGALGPPHPFPLRWLEWLGHKPAGAAPGPR